MPTASRILFAAIALAAASSLCPRPEALASGPPVSGLRMTVEKPRFTCERGGVSLSHVAYRPPGRPVLPCCGGQTGCAQFLSTRTVLHPVQRWHS